MKDLSQKEKAVNHETWAHIHRVQELCLEMAFDLIERAHQHDQSKLRPPEVGGFAEVTKRLKDLTYGTDEYRQVFQSETLRETLRHHYAHNRHHPDHFDEGVNDMTLVDLLEMMADWKAAGERHGDGDIRESIKINRERFNLSDQLVQILHNTADQYLASK